ncbi:MAG: hypothetical protein FWG18_02905 [Alphaproteobacteria bacterium]|nr:hypothetical protein [Alphaproteobacteria bacterium]
MKKMKTLIATVFAVAFISGAQAAAELVLYMSPTCPHCHHAHEYITDTLVPKYPDMVVTVVNVSDKNNVEAFKTAVAKCKLESFGVPLVVIGDKCFQGFGQLTGQQYIDTIDELYVPGTVTESRNTIANQLASDVKKNEKNPYVFLIALLGIVIIAGGFVLLSRRKKK